MNLIFMRRVIKIITITTIIIITVIIKCEINSSFKLQNDLDSSAKHVEVEKEIEK
jgi:hypothetical protein